MTIEALDIRLDAISRLARANWERTNPYDDWETATDAQQEKHRQLVICHVDALGDLLPTSVEQGSWSDQPLQSRYVTDWRPADA